MAFVVIRNVRFNAQLGPYETFAELEAAVRREMPGFVIIPPGPNATQGNVKDAQGGVIGQWFSPPFQLCRPVAFQALTGPSETLEELQLQLTKEAPGVVLVPPAKRLLGVEHAGEVKDAAGHVVGQWLELR